MEISPFHNIYHNKRVLVTGHSGFKGSWLTLWLSRMGATVFGLSHPLSDNTAHWRALKLKIGEIYTDIGDRETTGNFIRETDPEIIFHLAAQPLVRESYEKPIETWITNVIGTGNILESARACRALKGVIVITTDKCYQNNEWPWGYRETDHLGGHDPYSASKAGSELITASYRSSFFNSLSSAIIATGRAGNVIGGGDWSKDRLIPDLVRAIQQQKRLTIRSPEATRPWQHVLECLSGYLALGEKILNENRDFAEAWNFGPSDEANLQVREILKLMSKTWEEIKWDIDDSNQPHEAKLLMLDSSKAKSRLHWKTVWDIQTTATKTADWYKEFIRTGSIISATQIQEYVKDAANKKIKWAVI